MRKDLLYSMCWEDHEVILATVEPSDKVAMVCSAGDLVLSALTRDPASILAVDTNQDQLELLRLKQVAFAQLDDERLALLLGLYEPRGMRSAERMKVLLEDIEPLDDQQLCWLQVHNKALAQGLLHAGRFEHYLQGFSQKIFPLVVKRNAVQEFLKAFHLQDQETLYHKRIDTFLYKLCFKYFFGRYYMRKRGRHPDLLAHVQVAPDKVFYRRMQHAFCQVPVRENAFLTWMLRGFWKQSDPIPFAFQVEHRASIKTRLNRVKQLRIDMPSALEQLDQGSLDMVYLSDITETMSPSEAENLFSACARSVRKGGKMVLWNNLVQRKPTRLWKLDESLSNRLWKQRKVSFYGYLGVFTRI